MSLAGSQATSNQAMQRTAPRFVSPLDWLQLHLAATRSRARSLILSLVRCMQGDSFFYWVEQSGRLIFFLLPIALVLIAMIFLRRAHRTRRTLLLQVLAIAWFLAALVSSLASNPRFGLLLSPSRRIFSSFSSLKQAEDFMASYFKVATALFIVAQVLFILFATALFEFFRDRRRDSYLLVLLA